MKMIKLFYWVIALLPCFNAYGQQAAIIIKTCDVSKDSSRSWPVRKYTSSKMYYKGAKMLSKIDYSFNGWQVYDSITYKYIGHNSIEMSYRPIYDIKNKAIKRYKLESNDTLPQKPLYGILSEINDQYYLSKPYLSDLSFLFKQKPLKENDTFKFNDGIIPTLFSEYGIPYNEQINSFTYAINQEGQIINDAFFFENYTVKRQYIYTKSKRLKEVYVIIEDSLNHTNSEYRESFAVRKVESF